MQEATLALSVEKLPTIEELVELNYEPVYRFLRHLAIDVQTAEDLTQQTFLRAHQRLSSFRGDSAPRTWLFAIAMREYLGWKRRQKLKWTALRKQSPVDGGYDAVDDAAWLLAGLHRLSPTLRDAILLFEVHGFSVEEIASITDSPVGTVKSRLHHAREQLRNLLGQGESR